MTVDKLPAELLRKGRFDEIFFLGLPNSQERLNILDLHLKKETQLQFPSFHNHR